jgi:Reverse transcriptase (RNA-dependent DNA polymerase)
LTPANLDKFNIFSDYYSFGCSAMSSNVETGLLRGRPFGGVSFLVNNKIRNICKTVHCSERYAIVKIANYIIVSIYLPCVGTADRLSVCEDLFADVWAWRVQYPDCECIISGDFNVDLDCCDDVSSMINEFCSMNAMVRCDTLFGKSKCATYSNIALNHHSTIDFMITTAPRQIVEFAVLDPDINYSDHLPLFAEVNIVTEFETKGETVKAAHIQQLRWDHADLISYYMCTGQLLEPILRKIDDASCIFGVDTPLADCRSHIDRIYNEVVDSLLSSANQFVPHYRKKFLKFWWDEEMDLLKDASIESNGIWKAAGKPRYGPIFDKRQACRLQYRKVIRERQHDTLSSYSNDLHEALLAKRGTMFWKVWRSKFESVDSTVEVDGCSDANVVSSNFSKFFSDACSANSSNRAAELLVEFNKKRESYCGLPFKEEYLFDVELVSNVILNLKRGKAAGLDSLTAEHLVNCHPILPCILTKLFNLMIRCGYMPAEFGLSYTVPLPKLNSRTKSMACSDFRGIAISSILSKVFEYCILDRYEMFFTTKDNQFGFKKNVGCNHAIYTVRNAVNRFLHGGSTVNLCALDISKAFDKVNHNALFIKLMCRRVPIELLDMLVYWLANCSSCVKWNGVLSQFYKLDFGVRQGSVLSPFLFSVYMDDLIDNSYNGFSYFVILYADDIILITQSVSSLQDLLTSCELELSWLDLCINVNKSCCLRIGQRFDVTCKNIVTSFGYLLPWVTNMRYLGIFIVSSRIFRCSLVAAKRSYYRSLNAIFGKIGRSASEEVVLQLVSCKCLPILLYGLEACFLSVSDIRSLDFAVNRFLMKLFRTVNMLIITECMQYFNFKLPSVLLAERRKSFLQGYCNCDNSVCNIFHD